MPRLIDRNRQIPNGLTFLQPQTKWQPPRFASFNTICQGLQSHRQGNPELAAKYGWATDLPTIEREVDYYNALICKQMGWTDYYVDDGGAAPPPPKSIAPASLLSRAGQLAVGARTIIEWIRSGAEAVPEAQANKRAGRCVNCPKHGTGDLSSYFTVPAVAAIQGAINQRRDWKLSTVFDDKLQVCEGCYCPMKLKVHMPLAAILKEMPEETKKELVPECWILTEK